MLSLYNILILVARLLDYAVRGEVPQWDKIVTQQLCSHSNDKRLAAKQASETSALLFLGLFIAECGTIEQVPYNYLQKHLSGRLLV